MATPRRTQRALKLCARCPGCGTPTRLRIRRATQWIFAGLPPDAVVVVDTCYMEDCGRPYPITAMIFALAFSGSWERAEARLAEFQALTAPGT